LDLCGGCACGSTRFVVRAGAAARCATYCHCSVCRRAHGATSGVAWFTVPRVSFSWTSEARRSSFRSSAAAARDFCAACGSQLAFSRDGEDSVDVVTAALDCAGSSLPDSVVPASREHLEGAPAWETMPAQPPAVAAGAANAAPVAAAPAAAVPAGAGSDADGDTGPSDDDMLAVALGAARAAGAIIRRTAGLVAPSEKGGKSDLVTASDLECQAAVVAAVRSAFPAHAVLGEEDVPAGAEAAAAAIARVAQSPFLWIVDPIDGTTNFAAGLPLCCVSIAAARKGVVAVAVVYDPARDEAFTAVRGRGARLNGAPMRVGGAASLREALVGFGGLGRDAQLAAAALRGLGALSSRVRALRGLGSAALHLAYVAAGRLDACWDLSLSTWDSAAGALLVAEAGGAVTGFDGRPHALTTRDTLASNGAVHDALRAALEEAGAAPPQP